MPYQSPEEIRREDEKRRRKVFTDNLKYKCFINCNNNVLNALYDHYRIMMKIPHYVGLQGDNRHDWEKGVWNYIKNEYKIEYNRNLPELPDPKIGMHITRLLTSFEKMRIEDMVNRMIPEKAIKQLYGTES